MPTILIPIASYPDVLKGSLHETSAAHLLRLADEAEKKADLFNRKIAGWEAEITKAIAANDDAGEKLIKQGLDRDSVRKASGKFAAVQRSEMAQATEKERKAILDRLDEIAALAEALAPLFERASHMLARLALGQPERSRYLEQIRNAGPFELASLSQFAVATENKPLASALVSVCESMPREDQPFDPDAFAAVFLGDEHSRIALALVKMRNRRNEAFEADNAFRHGRHETIATIGLGLARRQEKGMNA